MTSLRRYLQLRSRSGLSVKKITSILHAPLIGKHNRELNVQLNNFSEEDHNFAEGSRIAQLVPFWVNGQNEEVSALPVDLRSVEPDLCIKPQEQKTLTFTIDGKNEKKSSMQFFISPHYPQLALLAGDWKKRQVVLYNLTNKSVEITQNSLLAQALAMDSVNCRLNLVKNKEQLSNTQRGAGGFGSTGIKKINNN